MRVEEKDSGVLIRKDPSNAYVRMVMKLMVNVMISTSVNWERIHVLRILYVQIFLVSQILTHLEIRSKTDFTPKSWIEIYAILPNFTS